MASTSEIKDEAIEAIGEQIVALRKEMARMRADLSQRGAAFVEEAGADANEFYGRARTLGARAGNAIGRGVHNATDTARENPLVSAAILGGIAVVVGALLLRR